MAKKVAQKSVRPTVRQGSLAPVHGLTSPVSPADKIGVHSATTVVKRLDSSNDYLQTLLHPATVYGVKVPDGHCSNSCTLTEINRVSWTVGTNGYRCGVVGVSNSDGLGSSTQFASLLPGVRDINTVGTTYWNLMDISNAACTVNDLWAGGASTLVAHAGDNATTPVISSTFYTVRLVSAGVRFSCAPNATTDQGYMTLAPLYKGISETATVHGPAALTTAYVMSLPGAVTIPARATGMGMSGIWVPLDNACMEFELTHTNLDISEAGFTTTSEFRSHDLGGWIMIAHGMAASTALMTEVCLNYELVPRTTAVFITATPTLNDPLKYSHALNRLQDADEVEANPNGFEHLDAHPLAGTFKEVALTPAPVARGAKATPLVAQDVSITMLGACRVTTLGSTRKGGRQQSPAGSSGDDTFTKIMSVVIPLAAKFLPELLGMLL